MSIVKALKTKKQNSANNECHQFHEGDSNVWLDKTFFAYRCMAKIVTFWQPIFEDSIRCTHLTRVYFLHFSLFLQENTLREIADCLVEDPTYKGTNPQYILEDISWLSDYDIHQLSLKHKVSSQLPTP